MLMKWLPKTALHGWLNSQRTHQARIEPRLRRIAAPFVKDDDPTLRTLESRATPAEFLGERDAAEAAGNLARLAELDGCDTGKDLADFVGLQPYRRLEVAAGATLYRGPGARRRLLIGFADAQDALGVPIPAFLQRMDAQRWDVLVLRDAEQCDYQRGVAGVGDDMAQVQAWLAVFVARYRHCATFGVRGGGLAAVWTGMALAAERAVCLSGQGVAHLNGQGFDAACAGLPDALQRSFLFAHGDGHADDADVARKMAAQTRGTAFAVPGSGDQALGDFLWKCGRLQAFLDVLLMGRMDAKYPALLARSLRVETALRVAARANQIPPVAKRVLPDGH